MTLQPGKMKYVSTRGWCDNTLRTLEQSCGQEVPGKKNMGPIKRTFWTWQLLSDASNLWLFCGALCRRKNRVSDGGAEEDYQCWNEDPCIYPLSKRAQEAGACRRSQEHVCVQTELTQLKAAWI